MEIKTKEELFNKIHACKAHSSIGEYNIFAIGVIFAIFIVLILLFLLRNTKDLQFLAYILLPIIISFFFDKIKDKPNQRYFFIIETIKNTNKFSSIVSSGATDILNTDEISKQLSSCKKLISKHNPMYGRKEDGWDRIIDIMHNTYKNINYNVIVIKRTANSQMREEFIVIISFTEKINIKESLNGFLKQNNIKVWGKGHYRKEEEYIILNKGYKHDKAFMLTDTNKECYFKRFDDVEDMYKNIIAYAERTIDKNKEKKTE